MHTVSVFYLVGIIIFIFAVIASISVFAYKKYLENSISKMQVELTNAREALQPNLIKELSRANARFLSAQSLLDSHVTLSRFFDLLQTLTLQSVRFNKFAYTMNDEGKVSVTLSGEARSYSALAVQSKVFSENPNFVDTIFSNLDLNESGNVVFSFKTQVNPRLISYSTYSNSLSPNVPILAPIVENGTSTEQVQSSSTPAQKPKP